MFCKNTGFFNGFSDEFYFYGFSQKLNVKLCNFALKPVFQINIFLRIFEKKLELLSEDFFKNIYGRHDAKSHL